MAVSTKKEKSKFPLRIPEELLDAVKESGAISERSANSEIIFQLKKAYAIGNKKQEDK